MKGDDTLQVMGVSSGARSPIMEVTIRNRGRRDAEVRTIGQARCGGSYVFGDLLPQTPFDVPAERTRPLVMGKNGGYKHGDVEPTRFFVVDGANRIHPLRERYAEHRQRARIVQAA